MHPQLRAFIIGLCTFFLLTTPLASAPRSQVAAALLNTPLSTTFTYQGRLEKAGVGINATCAMTFTLFDAATAGAQIGTSQAINTVVVSDGLFTVALNDTGGFGATAFDGSERHLEITILCPGDVSATTLPRQQLTATPYALTSLVALSTEALQGRPISTAAPTPGQNLTWNGSAWTPQTFSADVTAIVAGNGLTGGGTAGDVTLALDTAATDNRYWQVEGNANTPATGFLGTRNNVTLTMGISNTALLRLLTGTDALDGTFSPSLVAGHPSNGIAADVAGAIIAGGGRMFLGNRNVIFDSYGAILGGIDNRVGSDDNNTGNAAFGVVGGGVGNRASGELAIVGGGLENEASGQYAAILGGAAALAPLHGQVAHAAGAFSGLPGSAQSSMYILRNAGEGNLMLFLDGDDDTLAVRPGTSMIYTMQIIGRSMSNVEFTAAYRIDGVLYTNDAGTTINSVGLPIFMEGRESNFPGDLNALITVADGTLQINVENSTGHAMRWVATVYATEVMEN